MTEQQVREQQEREGKDLMDKVKRVYEWGEADCAGMARTILCTDYRAMKALLKIGIENLEKIAPGSASRFRNLPSDSEFKAEIEATSNCVKIPYRRFLGLYMQVMSKIQRVREYRKYMEDRETKELSDLLPREI